MGIPLWNKGNIRRNCWGTNGRKWIRISVLLFLHIMKRSVLKVPWKIYARPLKKKRLIMKWFFQRSFNWFNRKNPRWSLYENPRIKHIENTKPNGFGFAVRSGFEQADGEWVAVMMADALDDPRDQLSHLKEHKKKPMLYLVSLRTCGKVVNYPTIKLFLIASPTGSSVCLFAIRYSDVTNAFKLYRRSTLLDWNLYLVPISTLP